MDKKINIGAKADAANKLSQKAFKSGKAADHEKAGDAQLDVYLDTGRVKGQEAIYANAVQNYLAHGKATAGPPSTPAPKDTSGPKNGVGFIKPNGTYVEGHGEEEHYDVANRNGFSGKGEKATGQAINAGWVRHIKEDVGSGADNAYEYKHTSDGKGEKLILNHLKNADSDSTVRIDGSKNKSFEGTTVQARRWLHSQAGTSQ
jgi:hypothetical protein